MSQNLVSTSTPKNQPEIKAPSEPSQYRAVGLIKGQFIPSEDDFHRGVLVTPDLPFPAILMPKIKTPPTTEVIWRVWMRTKNNEEGLRFVLMSYAHDTDGTPVETHHLEQDYFSIRGNLLWWDTEKEDPCFGIRINPNRSHQRSFKPFFITIYGTLSKPKKDAFWEVTATRKGKQLVFLRGQEIYSPRELETVTTTTTETISTNELHRQVVAAIGQNIGKSTLNRWLSQGIVHERLASYCNQLPFEVAFAEKSGNKNFYYLKRHKKTRKPPSSSEVQSQFKPKKSSISPIIMVKGRTPEITIKFNEKIDLPSKRPKVPIEVQGENNIKIRAMLNYKTLKKQVAKMEEYEEWVGALSGRITNISPDGIVELEAAGIQVFEKKKKES